MMRHNTIGLPIWCHQRNGIGRKEHRKKEAVQPFEPTQIGQCKFQLRQGQMRKHCKGNRMGDLVRNAGKFKPGIFDQLNRVQSRRVRQFRAPSCQHDRTRSVSGPVMARCQIWNSFAPQPQRPGPDIEKVMMRQKPHLSKDTHLDPPGFFPAPADNGTVPPGSDRRVIEADLFIRVR